MASKKANPVKTGVNHQYSYSHPKGQRRNKWATDECEIIDSSMQRTSINLQVRLDK